MRTLVMEPLPPEVEALIERRRRLGQDRYDEMWDGVLHMNSAPSFEHQRISQRLAVLLDPLARAAGLEPVVGGVLALQDTAYRPVGGSAIIDLTAEELPSACSAEPGPQSRAATTRRC